MIKILPDTQYDFLGKRRLALRISLVALAITAVSLIAHGGPRFGIDFRGGTMLQLRFDTALEISDIRSSLGAIGMGAAEIKTMGTPEEIMIRVKQSETGGSTPDQIRAALQADFPSVSYEVRQLETVGPRIGAELITSSIWAIVVAMLLMVLYISIRFEFRFAVGALVALAHDVLITIGVFSILDVEVSLSILAALLTIVGYSLNDTIVVFDRVRENMKLLRKEDLVSILNRSINSTLSRTIITSGTTLLVVLTLYVFGGEVFGAFALALLVGIIAGTYSSIFIASPVLVYWEERAARKGLPTRKRR